MAGEKPPESQDPLDELHSALQDWRQGDLFPGSSVPTVVVFDRTQPLTPATSVLAQEVDDTAGDTLLGEQEFETLVITSQTCDIVEHPKTFPYVTASPLVRIADDGQANEARRGYMPRYPPVPGGGEDAFADLALSTTIEKAVLASVVRTAGLRDDEEIRRFQRITQRHYGRFAFPDEVAPALRLLRERLRDKKAKDSFEGKALGLVEEIRVLATPDWAVDSVDVDLYFLLKSRAVMDVLEPDSAKWEAQRVAWESRCVPTGPIKAIRLILVPLAELDAETYVASDPWDLGGMSPQ